MLAFYVASNSVLSANGAAVATSVFALHVDSGHATVISMNLPGKVGLYFGARLGTSSDTTADVVECDGTVLTMGPVQCPSAPAFAPRATSVNSAAASRYREPYTMD